MRPDRQRLGLGRLLPGFAEAEAGRRGWNAVTLHSDALMAMNIAIDTARGYLEREIAVWATGTLLVTERAARATFGALVLAHIDIAEKSNEIPAAQKLFAELGLADGAILTMDALHCQKNFEVTAVADTALIVQVEDNQPTLNQRIQEIAATTAPVDAVGSRTKGRNRDERRTVTVFRGARCWQRAGNH
jgi:GNAT superfamily N-acetyltransferase